MSRNPLDNALSTQNAMERQLRHRGWLPMHEMVVALNWLPYLQLHLLADAGLLERCRPGDMAVGYWFRVPGVVPSENKYPATLARELERVYEAVCRMGAMKT